MHAWISVNLCQHASLAFCGEFTGDWWIPLTKGQVCGEGPYRISFLDAFSSAADALTTPTPNMSKLLGWPQCCVDHSFKKYVLYVITDLRCSNRIALMIWKLNLWKKIYPDALGLSVASRLSPVISNHCSAEAIYSMWIWYTQCLLMPWLRAPGHQHPCVTFY